MLHPKQHFLKRSFDLLVSLMVLPLVLVIIMLLLIPSTLSTGTFGWFSQDRIGRKGKTFRLFKIRTLKGEAHESVIAMQQAETRVGSWMRRAKLDELPQVWNVLWGDMSWVGPRPDVPGYADRLEGDDRIILSVRPGITGPATLKYKNEEKLLLQQADPNRYNDEVIWPDKVSINKEYVQNWSLKKDVGYLWRSVYGG